MDSDESIVVRALQERFNEVLIKSNFKARPDPVEIENDLVEDVSIMPASILDELKTKITATSKIRIRTSREVRRDIVQAWAPALGHLDECLALADLLNTRFVQVIFATGSDVLRTKNPRPDSDALTGAYLKCLLLLSLYGKSCCIATEILALLKDGFPDGAISRLRTLHEHLVILMLLHNDRTYELSERFQDHAVFEQLKQLRAERRSYAEPMWNKPSDYDHKTDLEITELTGLTRKARAKWGPAIQEQYGWARPVLPRKKRNNRRIYFSDLEQVVGMEFLRGDYLTGNDRIHAGASSAINHLDFTSPGISPIRPRRNDEAITFIGCRTAKLIGWAARAAGRTISWETEEYDEFFVRLRDAESCGRRNGSILGSWFQTLSAFRIGAQPISEVCRVLLGLAFGLALAVRPARGGRGSRVNSAPQARRAQRDAKHC